MYVAAENSFRENSVRKLGRPIGGVGKRRIKEESIFTRVVYVSAVCMCECALSYEEVTAFGNILRRSLIYQADFDIVCVFRHCTKLSLITRYRV